MNKIAEAELSAYLDSAKRRAGLYWNLIKPTFMSEVRICLEQCQVAKDEKLEDVLAYIIQELV
jgi:hypothetical protein